MKNPSDKSILENAALRLEFKAAQGGLSAILGPPRHGLMAFACGWHSQTEQDAYDTEAKIAGDLRSLEFLADCGLDGVSDCHPWGGESRKLAALREGQRYELDERSLRFLEHARELDLKVVQWLERIITSSRTGSIGPARARWTVPHT